MIDKVETAPVTAVAGKRRRPRWLRRLSIASERGRLIRWLELAALLALLGMGIATYFIAFDHPEGLLPPPVVAALLVGNLVPAMALMVFAARRIAKRRVARSPTGGKGRLHVRLVAFFSLVASLPTILVVIFASLLFQAGLEFWFSERAQTVLASARNASEIYEREHRDRIQLDVQVMGGDMADRINQFGLESEAFRYHLVYQTAARQLSESAILTLDPQGNLHGRVEWNPDHRPVTRELSKEILLNLKAGEVRVFRRATDRVEAIVRLDPEAAIYFYGARAVSPDAYIALANARDAASAYQETLNESRGLQLRFNVILIVASLLIVGLAIWLALALADRLVRPVRHLVQAARQVTAGDLSTRVPSTGAKDEVAALGSTFNRMTERLEAQTGALVAANTQLDTRRAFIEAVLSGVSAGILSVDRERRVRLINSSAEALLKTGDKAAVGQQLAELSPELDRHLGAEEGEDIVQISSAGEIHTLAVKRVATEAGHVLTFDDITEQLVDQRRAAWSDVARRIAHEIKNPLTPIQLAAERLQRRYGKEIESDPATFERLTGTIVRQVGDLRRMVDEFSSFARMPKPVFEREAVVDIARQALFLHEVAHPDIRFVLTAPEPPPTLICDRRLLGQALTNIVKNGVEAIQQKREEEGAGGAGEDRVEISIKADDKHMVIAVGDTGIGLPTDRRRLTEPYMTTRTKGTGLGLAIVKKIVEDHFGQISFEDPADGGACVRLTFDLDMLGRINTGPAPISEETHADG
jgi:two-component system nitrogen regulation sensor histidine kinase NtrY